MSNPAFNRSGPGLFSRLFTRIRKLVVEIAVIVFGVTVSIWFQEWSLRRQDREDVRFFLVGLKNDLRNDVAEMKEDMDSYIGQGKAFSYISRAGRRHRMEPDSLRQHVGWLFNSTSLVVNSGRYEGFKSSGKIEKIENEAIKNSILDLYQEAIPNILVSTSHYIRMKEQFWERLLENNPQQHDSLPLLGQALLSPPCQNLAVRLRETDQTLVRYQMRVQQMEGIIRRIEAEYPQAEK